MLKYSIILKLSLKRGDELLSPLGAGLHFFPANQCLILSSKKIEQIEELGVGSQLSSSYIDWARDLFH